MREMKFIGQAIRWSQPEQTEKHTDMTESISIMAHDVCYFTMPIIRCTAPDVSVRQSVCHLASVCKKRLNESRFCLWRRLWGPRNIVMDAGPEAEARRMHGARKSDESLMLYARRVSLLSFR